MKQIAVCLTLMSLAYTVSALNCKSCMYMKADNEQVNDVLDTTMQAMSSDQLTYGSECKDNAKSVVSMNCGSITSCMAMKITAKFEGGGSSAKMEMFFRTCGDSGEGGYGCKDMKDYEDKLKETMGATAAMMKEMGGLACSCNTTNCNIMGSAMLSAATIPTSRATVVISIMATLALLFFRQ